jgi:hypothetical protein
MSVVARIPDQPDSCEDGLDHPFWLRQPGEPARWFGRFTAYRLLGGTRSLRKAYLTHLRERGTLPEGREHAVRVPVGWAEAARRFAWAERARAWDDALLRETEQAVRERRRREVDERYRLLSRGRDKLHALLEVVDPADAAQAIRPHEVLKLVALLNRDSRDEFDEPARRHKAAERQTTASAVTFADLVAIAQQIGSPPVEVHVHAHPAAPGIAATPPDAKFRELSQGDKPENASRVFRHTG